MHAGRNVLIGGVYHETHCFLDGITRMADFDFAVDDAVLANRGNGSQLAGLIDAGDRYGWHMTGAAYGTAQPSAKVADHVLEHLWSCFQPRLLAALEGGLDAILLALHGAMVCESHEDPEGEFLRRIRATPGAESLPLFAVFDLHATITDQMASHADALVSYRENPHTDAYETGVRTAALLERCLATGVRPTVLHRTLPIVWAPSGTGTADSPMADLEQAARALEDASPAIQVINIVAGFAYADIRDVGVSVSAVTTDAVAAERALDQLAAIADRVKALGLIAPPGVDDVLARILPVNKGPVILVEPSDNVGGGAPGDGTGILRALLAHAVPNCGVIINDPAAVRALADTPVGACRRLAIGGRGSRIDLGPVEVEAALVSRSDGHFRLEDPHSHLAASDGVDIEMGDCAVVRASGVTILLTSRPTAPFDLGQWRSQRIDPEDFAIIGVKAAVGHRQAYDPIAVASYTVETRGPCPSDVTTLPYHNIRRPVFPLDP